MCEQGADRVQGVRLYRLDYLDVGPGGNRDRAVAQDPLQRCRLHAHREEQGGAGMSKSSCTPVACVSCNAETFLPGVVATDLATQHHGTDANKRDGARQLGRLNVDDLDL